MNQQRRCRLPHKALQLRLIGVFAGMAAVGLCLQFAFTLVTVRSALVDVPTLAPEVGDQILRSLWGPLGLTAVLVLPLTVTVGIFVTFRLAGPAYGVEQYLRAVARGENRGECRVRKDDELKSLAEAVNLALDRVRSDRGAAESEAAVVPANPEPVEA